MLNRIVAGSFDWRAAQRIDIRPVVARYGETPRVVITGAAPFGEVTVSADRQLTVTAGDASLFYRSEATFLSDSAGTVDLARARPVRGTYEGVDPAGLFWSMRVVPGDLPLSHAKSVRLSVREVGRETAVAFVKMLDGDPRVETRRVAALPGAVLARFPDAKLRAAILVLGGSEGGDRFVRTMAPRLASEGYAVLGLPYYAPAYLRRNDLADLPSAFVDLPLERLQKAYELLRQDPSVDCRRVGVYGVSKGAELALIGATKFSWISAVAAIAPSDVVWEGWGAERQEPATRSSFSWRGAAVPFVPYGPNSGAFDPYDQLARHERARAVHPEHVLAARIPVDAFRGQLLLAAGAQDRIWPSALMTENIARARSAAGLSTTTLIFQDAGHALSGDGHCPTAPLTITGGTPRGIANAQVLTWRAVVAFFAAALGLPPRLLLG